MKELQLEGASDTTLWTEAGLRSVVIVTRDADFSTPRLTRQSRPPVVWVRIGNCSAAELVAKFMSVLPELQARLKEGELLVELR